MKLAAIGVSVDGIGFASSSDAHARTKIMELAAERALRGTVPATRTYFGDGAWDQRASAELGYRFIAIGRAVEHEPRFDDYTDSDAVLARLARLALRRRRVTSSVSAARRRVPVRGPAMAVARH